MPRPKQSLIHRWIEAKTEVKEKLDELRQETLARVTATPQHSMVAGILPDDARVAMTAILAKLKGGADLLQSWLAQQSEHRQGEAWNPLGAPRAKPEFGGDLSLALQETRRSARWPPYAICHRILPMAGAARI